MKTSTLSAPIEKTDLVKRSQILAKVEKVHSSEISDSDVLFTTKNEYSILVHTPHGRKKVNDCSAEYNLISNADILIPFETELQKHFKFSVRYNHEDYSKFYIQYDLQVPAFKINKKDNLIPTIKIHTSYNGELKHTIISGAYREVCKNGMVLPIFDQSLKFKHSKRMSKEFAMQIMLEKIEQYAAEFNTHIKTYYEPLFDKKVENYIERIEYVLRGTDFPKRQLPTIIQRAEIEAEELNQPITDWIIYNSFNYQLNHNEKIGFHEDFKEKIDLQILNLMLEQ